jgi:hypothetical protein
MPGFLSTIPFQTRRTLSYAVSPGISSVPAILEARRVSADPGTLVPISLDRRIIKSCTGNLLSNLARGKHWSSSSSFANA